MNAQITLDERYFEWLCNLVQDTHKRPPSETNILLMEILYKTPFEWFVPNDHNRAEDGRKLRVEFLEASGHWADHDWLALDCSIFEMLLGVSRRLDFQSAKTTDFWFWKLLQNLGIDNLDDERMHHGYIQTVERSLHNLNARLYEPSGHGGLFPLTGPIHKDQREVEIWYQMSYYLMEHEELLW